MKIALITDAWSPQVNGVVTTMTNVSEHFRNEEGADVKIIHPGLFAAIPCPGYGEIPIVINPWKLFSLLDEFAPDSIHIAVEGPLGFFARIYCRFRGLAFTTSYHTQFPEYLETYLKPHLGRASALVKRIAYQYFKWFHMAAASTLVTTPTMKSLLTKNGFTASKLILWPRGVNSSIFKPQSQYVEKNIAVYFGRVSAEKNIEAFLDLELSSTKWVIGDGPVREKLEKAYPNVKFWGYKFGEELSDLVSQASVFVFPSRTDTYGVVMLEANACGVPVAAYPVQGPIDVIEEGINGSMNEDLLKAVLTAMTIDRKKCREAALKTTWAKCADIMYQNLVCVNSAIPLGHEDIVDTSSLEVVPA